MDDHTIVFAESVHYDRNHKETGRLRRVLIAGFLLMMLLGAVETQSTQERPPAPRTVWDRVFFHAQADRGEVDFSRHCARCHDGSGDGLILSSEEFFNGWREERLS